MFRTVTATFIVLMIAACGDGVPTRELKRLQADVDAAVARHPEIGDLDAVVNARVTGRNGWPDIVAAAELYSDIQRERRYHDDWPYVDLPANSLSKALARMPEAEKILPDILEWTAPVIEKLREAARADCLVWCYDGGSIARTMDLFHLLDLRQEIQRHLGRHDEALEDAALYRELAWRVQGLDPIAIENTGAMRIRVAYALHRLARDVPANHNLLDKALEQQPAPLPDPGQAWLCMLAQNRLKVGAADQNDLSSPLQLLGPEMSPREFVRYGRAMWASDVRLWNGLREQPLDIRKLDDAIAAWRLAKRSSAELKEWDEITGLPGLPERTLNRCFSGVLVTEVALAMLALAKFERERGPIADHWDEAAAIVAAYPPMELARHEGRTVIQPVKEHPVWKQEYPPRMYYPPE
jgi:hypothetical protein